VIVANDERLYRTYRLEIVVAERDDCEPIGPRDIRRVVAGQLLSGAILHVGEVLLKEVRSFDKEMNYVETA
jgi:hypothetical protein